MSPQDPASRLSRLHARVVDTIPCVPKTAKANLRGMPLWELLGRHLNWKDRFIRTRPRRAVTWPGFLEHGAAADHTEAIRALSVRIEGGEDLTPFLSDRIHRDGYVQRQRRAHRRRGIEWQDKDYVLNAYGVHHLHLRPSGSDELLYVSFSRDDAFFLMLGDHRGFDDGSLATAVAAARVGTAREFSGVLPSPSRFSDAEREQLQRHGFTTTMTVEGHTVLAAMLSSAGTSPQHTRHADRMYATMVHLEPTIDQPGFGREWFESNGRTLPAQPAFEWHIEHCDLCLVETTTGTAFNVLRWHR